MNTTGTQEFRIYKQQVNFMSPLFIIEINANRIKQLQVDNLLLTKMNVNKITKRSQELHKFKLFSYPLK